MSYYKFQGDQLFTGYELLHTDHVLIVDEKGTVKDIVMATDAGDNIQKVKGIVTPGLINCHCHLELSHLKNVIPPHTGLIEFLCSVVTKRNFEADVIQEAIVRAEQEMYHNGIVAVGDICNTVDTVEVKSKSKIRWQNFVEVISFTDEKAEENIKQYQAVLEAYNEIRKPRPNDSAGQAKSDPDLAQDRNSLVPHAPYSISPKTFKLINELTNRQIISMHNQEHPAEDELYKTGAGDFLKLFSIFGVNQSPFPVTGKTSIRSCLPYFQNGQTIFLIHNTYMPEEDIQWANEYAEQNGLQLVYCLCPNANLYIENRLPRIDLLLVPECQSIY